MHRSPRTATIHGRILSIGHLAVITACVGKFLSVVALMLVMMYACVAAVPALGLTLADLHGWAKEIEANDYRIPPALDKRIGERLTDRLPAMEEAFLRARDGYAAPLIAVMLAIGVLVYALFVLVSNYVYEGMTARPVEAKAGPLLQRARDALPPGFPPAELRLARATFVRQRLRGGIIAFLENRLLVLLRQGHAREFRFVVAHELYHLRCFDPLVSWLAKSFRRLLALIGMTGCFFIAIEWTRPVAGKGCAAGLLQLLLAVGVSYVALRRWWSADLPFFRHKELLADRFAYDLDPGVDLTRTWEPGRPRPSHPSADERLAFLREGSTGTAYATFLTAQELLLCFLFLFDTRGMFDDFSDFWPRVLDVPCLTLAIAGSLIFAAEACRYPIPQHSRRDFATHTAVLLLLALVFASQREATSWFFLAQAAVITVVALRAGAPSPSSAPAHAVPEEVPEPAVAEDRVAGLHRALDRIGRGLSWAVVVYGLATLLYVVAMNLVIGGVGGGLPAGLTTFWDRSPLLMTFVQGGLLIAVALRNLRRPHVLTVAAEWAAYAVTLFFFAAASFLVSDWIGTQTVSEASVEILRLPWGAPPETFRAQAGWRVDYLRAFRVTLLPQLLLAAFYAHRIHRLILDRRKEQAHAATRT